jgi:GAF domain-containing protein
VTKANSAHQFPRSYWVYSVGLLVLLLCLCLAIGLSARFASRNIESYLVDLAGRGLTQSVTVLAESLNRALFEHSLQSQTIAQSPLLRRPDPDAVDTYLRTLKATWPEYMSLEVIDADGHVTAATDPSHVGRDVNQHAWYKALLEGGVALRGRDVFEPAGRHMLFPSPIVGNEGQFLGVVVLQVGLQSMEFILDGARRSTGPRSSIARGEYVLVAHDGDGHNSLVLYDSAHHEGIEARHARMDGATLSASVNPGYREELHPERKLPVVTGYAPVNRYGQVPGWQWTLLIRMDREAILMPFHRLVATMMIWGGLGLLVFMAVLLWIIGRLRTASAAPRQATAEAIPVASAKAREPLRHAVHETGPRAFLRKAEPGCTEPFQQSPRETLAFDPERWEEFKRWVRVAEVNRVCLFKNHREDGELWASRRYEWIGLGEVARTEWSQWFSWSLRAKGFSRWEHTLAQGQVISGAVATFPPAEAAALMSCGIHTVFVVPLYIRSEWWGFVEFDHCFTERIWSEPEQQGLRTMVDLLQNVVEQASGEADLQRLLAIIDTVLESTADGILVVDGDGTLVNFNQRLVSMWNMPDAVTESRLTEEIMGWMMRQLKSPDVLLRTMSELGGEPEAESYDILELQDGRMVERLSKPRKEGDRYDGRIWTFRESIALRLTTLNVHSSQ